MPTRSTAAVATALAAGLAALAALAAAGMVPAQDARILCVVFVCILLWATGAIPGYLVSLLFFLLAVTLTNVPVPEIFSGFASSAFWLVFSGGVIGFALRESGLSDRVGAILARIIGRSYLKSLLAFAAISFALCLVMPSTFGRIAILVPIAAGYCSVAGLERPGRGRDGILLLVIVGSFELAAGVLPANLPNIIMAGVLEHGAGFKVSFSDYLYIFFPAAVLVRGAVLVAVSYLMFPDTVSGEPPQPAIKPLSAHEVRVIVLLSATLTLWLTDSIHHLAPGWVGLGFSLAYLLTSNGREVAAFGNGQKMDLLWFIAAIMGLTAIVHHVDLSPLTAWGQGEWARDPRVAYAVLVAVSIAICFVATSNAEPALYTPLATSFLAGGGFLKMGLLAQVMGYSTTFLAYQAPPILFGADLAGIKGAAVARYCLVTAGLGLLFVVPANAAWWWLIGLIPSAPG